MTHNIMNSPQMYEPGTFGHAATWMRLLNEGLNENFGMEERPEVSVDGTPRLDVIRFKPLEFERYGKFRNRAPHITGKLAVLGMITEYTPRPGTKHDYTLHAGVRDADGEMYGFEISDGDPKSLVLFDKIAALSGYAEVRATKG